MQKDVARFLVGHVLVDCHDVDALATHGLQDRLQFVFMHGEVAINHRMLIVAGKGRPGIDAHFIADGGSMHLGCARVTFTMPSLTCALLPRISSMGAAVTWLGDAMSPAKLLAGVPWAARTCAMR